MGKLAVFSKPARSAFLKAETSYDDGLSRSALVPRPVPLFGVVAWEYGQSFPLLHFPCAKKRQATEAELD